MGACVKKFEVTNCLGDVIEAGIHVGMGFLTATLFSILKIISEHMYTNYLSHQYNTVGYQHFYLYTQ